MRRHQRHRFEAFERQPPGHQLEDHGSHRVDVGTRVDRTAGQLLGGGIGDGADELIRVGQPRLVALLAHVRDPEVHDLVDAAIAEVVRDDVGRLQIAMDDAARMGERQRGTHRRDDALQFLDRKPAAFGELVPQTGPAEQLHHQERPLRVVGVVVEDRDDVGVAKLGADPALTDEALDRRRAFQIRQNHLDRDVVAKQDAAGPVDRTHAAFRQRRKDLIPPVEDLTDREHT